MSGTGDALYWVALVVVLVRSDRSGPLLAAAVVARLAPRLLLGPFAGGAADRFDRARLMMTLDAARAALMLVLAAAVATDGPPLVLVSIVFLVAAFGTPYRPAMTARLAGAVGERLLAPANALMMSVAQAVGLTGPVLAAALLAVASPAWAFVANAGTFLVAIVLVGRSRTATSTMIRFEAPAHRGWAWALSSGVRTIRRQDGLAVVIGLAAALAVVRGAEMVLYVRLAQDSLGLGAGGYGLVAGAVGAGALLALPVAARGTAGLAVSVGLVVAAAGSVIPVALVGMVHLPAVVLAVLVLQGMANAVFEVQALTAIQRLCPPGAIGRVIGVHTATSGGARLVGALVATAATAAIGADGGLVLIGATAAGVVAALALPVLALGRRLRQRRLQLDPIIERLAGLGIFAWSARPTVERLAMQLSVLPVPAGTVVIREGAVPDDFYVVAEGHLVADTAGHVVNRLGPDDWCGELGLLHQMPRVATVTAETDAVLWRIPGDELITALTANARLPDALIDDMEVRLADSRAVLR